MLLDKWQIVLAHMEQEYFSPMSPPCRSINKHRTIWTRSRGVGWSVFVKYFWHNISATPTTDSSSSLERNSSEIFGTGATRNYQHFCHGSFIIKNNHTAAMRNYWLDFWPSRAGGQDEWLNVFRQICNMHYNLYICLYIERVCVCVPYTAMRYLIQQQRQRQRQISRV